MHIILEYKWTKCAFIRSIYARSCLVSIHYSWMDTNPYMLSNTEMRKRPTQSGTNMS